MASSGFFELAIIPFLGITGLVGSIVAFRVKRTWGTWLLLLGTILLALGFIAAFGGAFFGWRASGNPSGVWAVMMAVGGIAAGSGLLMSLAGFLGLCLRYSATVRRTRQLEEMVAILTDRFDTGTVDLNGDA